MISKSVRKALDSRSDAGRSVTVRQLASEHVVALGAHTVQHAIQDCLAQQLSCPALRTAALLYRVHCCSYSREESQCESPRPKLDATTLLSVGSIRYCIGSMGIVAAVEREKQSCSAVLRPVDRYQSNINHHDESIPSYTRTMGGVHVQRSGPQHPYSVLWWWSGE